MGYILNLNEDKTLILSAGVTYVGENNADKITCILPHYFNGYDLKECIVILHIMIPNSDGSISGDAVRLDIENDLYKGKYISHANISNAYTNIKQSIYLSIEIVNSDSMVAYSNEVSFEVKSHYNINKAIDKGSLTIFDQYMYEIKKIRDECIAIRDTMCKGGENT